MRLDQLARPARVIGLDGEENDVGAPARRLEIAQAMGLDRDGLLTIGKHDRDPPHRLYMRRQRRIPASTRSAAVELPMAPVPGTATLAISAPPGPIYRFGRAQEFRIVAAAPSSGYPVRRVAFGRARPR